VKAPLVMALKPVAFHGDTLDRLRSFPEDVRRQAAARLSEKIPEDLTARFEHLDALTAAEGTMTMPKPKIFTNVWDALENSPEEAAAMTMRSNVLAAVSDAVRDWNTTQADAARRLRITQPRLNDLLRGKINKFSLDTLLVLPTRAGLKIKIEIGVAA
jgi:predicted XRE-type DNA-binding protein